MTTRVIIPVMDEAENVAVLMRELDATGLGLSVDFIDDSRDMSTVAAIDEAKDLFPDLSVSRVNRTGTARTGGIIGAVAEGIRRAQSDGFATVIVIDGDGQHDPAFIATMVDKLRLHAIVPGSRYARGGSLEGLAGPIRVAGSLCATWVAKGLFPKELKGLSDPMSGFFGVRADMIDTSTLGANGFKVLLEIMLTHTGLSRDEVPVVFRSRHGGASKANSAIAVEYLSQLVRRRWMLSRNTPSNEGRLSLENV